MRFKSPVRTNAKTLGDIVLIQPSRPTWDQIPLETTFKAGSVLTGEQICQWLQMKMGKQSIEWLGPRQTKIKGMTQTTGVQLENLAKQVLIEAYQQQEFAKVELTSANKLSDSERKLEDIKIQLHGDNLLRNPVCVEVNSEKEQQLACFKVKAWKKVWCANNKMKARQMAQKNKFSYQLKNVVGIWEEPVAKLPEKIWLRHTVNKDDILTKHHIGAKPAVLRDESICLSLRSNGIKIQVHVKALADGFVGETIDVLNPGSQVRFKVRITGIRKAEVLT